MATGDTRGGFNAVAATRHYRRTGEALSIAPVTTGQRGVEIQAVGIGQLRGMHRQVSDHVCCKLAILQGSVGGHETGMPRQAGLCQHVRHG